MREGPRGDLELVILAGLLLLRCHFVHNFFGKEYFLKIPIIIFFAVFPKVYILKKIFFENFNNYFGNNFSKIKRIFYSIFRVFLIFILVVLGVVL